MLVSEFVKQYNDIKIDTVKEKLVKEHVVNKYVSIVEKNAMANIALNKSIATDENGISYIDMVANKINVTYGIIRLYTDLEPNLEKDSNGKEIIAVIKMYDMLCENGLFSLICSYIDERELLEFTTVNENALDVWNQKNMTTQAFILKMLDRVTRTVTELTATLPLLLEKPEIKELLKSVDLNKLTEIAKDVDLNELEAKISSPKN